MKINGKTKVIGVIGNPIEHTASPAMHNTAFQYLDINYVYIPILVEADKLGSAIEAVRACHFAGLNVTVPYKEAVIPFLDDCDPIALKMGAVNTIVNQNGKLVGYNTDGEGFAYSLLHEGKYVLKGKAVFIIGAGGAAKGLAHILKKNQIQRLMIYDRDNEKAAALVSAIKENTEISILHIVYEDQDLNTFLRESDLVVNATPVGMAPNADKAPLLDFSWATTEHLCYDIIYKPEMTVFLQNAKQKGAQVLGGAGMLAGQGMIAFELFTGHTIPFEIMREQV